MDTIRTATWNVDKNLEILPEAPLYGGVQGEDKATLLVFNLQDGCPALNDSYQLYIEHVSATGEWDRSDVVTPDQDGRVTYEVPLAWTQHGGLCTVRLVAMKDGQTAFSAQGRLKYNHRATAKRAEKNVVQTLVQDVLNRFEEIIDSELSDGGVSVVDVIQLPTEEINENCFYRLLTARFVDGCLTSSEAVRDGWRCEVVAGLPDVGEKVICMRDAWCYYAYYNVIDNTVYGYVSSDVTSICGGRPIGWYPFDELASDFRAGTEFNYGGVLRSADDADGDNFTKYVLLSYNLYTYRNGQAASIDIGVRGVGFNAEVFNSTQNTAEGDYSHAEGRHTHAKADCSHSEGGYTAAVGLASHAEGYYASANGHYSHAEGSNTRAIGNAAHAEGNATNAEGSHSHAEGLLTHAQGDFSHAEGENSRATGDASHAEGNNSVAESPYSHAEGNGTCAVGRSQHVQGEYNVIDERVLPEIPEPDPNIETPTGNEERDESIPPEYDPEADSRRNRGKYAHIVGNGTSDENRSNAHTIDWDGNAWFAGTVKVGGTGQDDKNAKELATKEYVDSASVMIVVWGESTNQTSHTSAQIYEHIQNGGTVILKADGFYTLQRVTKDAAEFGRVDAENCVLYCFAIDGYGRVANRSVHTLATDVRVNNVDITRAQDWNVDAKAIARDNIGVEARPVRVTVTKQGAKYVASKTFKELEDILAEDEHRSIICVFNNTLLTMVPYNLGHSFDFISTTSIWQSIRISISNTSPEREPSEDHVRVFEDSHSITIGEQLWDEDDPEADFTDTINGMIDDKIGKIETDLDGVIALQNSLIGGDGE